MGLADSSAALITFSSVSGLQKMHSAPNSLNKLQ